MVLLARTTPRDQVAKPTDGMSVLLVDLREAVGHGLTIRPIRTMLNHATTELFFDDLEVPAANLIGEEGKGFRYILDGMNAERILIASECIGDARFFIDRASAYARERQVFGRPIGQNQGVQFPIARAYVQTDAAALMVQKATELFEAGRPCGSEANMAKLVASEASWFAGDICLQTFGGYGFAEEYDIERKFRETRLYQVAPISTNLILSHVGDARARLAEVVLMAALSKGILVVALEHAVAAPFCSSRLADAGARVIKIERPEGDFARAYDHVVHGESAYFVWLNRGKELIVLDIKDPGDAALLQRMTARADVFIQNLGAGAAERAGFGSDAAAAKLSAPDHLRHFRLRRRGAVPGHEGLRSADPVRERPGLDHRRAGAARPRRRLGGRHRLRHVRPRRHPAGALPSRAHRRGKRRRRLAVRRLADWMTVPLLHHDYGGKAPERVGLEHPSIAPYGAFATADGKQVVISIQNEREWRDLCEKVLERPEHGRRPALRRQHPAGREPPCPRRRDRGDLRSRSA